VYAWRVIDCPACSSDASAGSRFCSSCRAAIETPGFQKATPGSLVAVVFLLGVFLFLGCTPADIPHSTDPSTVSEWMTENPTDWPRIAMINRIEYVDNEHPSAACGFLVDTGDEILAATAKHVLIYFKSEAMDSVSFAGTLKTWRMFPKDSAGDAVVIDRLINEDPKERLERIPSSRDWLLFTVRETTDAVQPLRLRRTPLEKGETVYAIGWRYPDEGPQRVHRGRFVRMDEGSVLVSIDALKDNTVPGLSGSPVIDAKGYVIGLMSKKAGTLQRLAPANYALDLLAERRKNEGASTQIPE